MEEKLKRFALACQEFHQQSALFESWNKDYLMMEAGFLLFVNCQELKFVVPLRMDLIHYPDPTDQFGKPNIYDLKTSIELPDYPQRGGRRISISPLLYRIAASQLPLNIWKEIETKKEIPELWLREPELRLTSELPSFTILGYREKREKIRPSTLNLPDRWENKLLAQLKKVQKILEEKNMALASNITPRLNSRPRFVIIFPCLLAR
jgi:hypothetical protein